MKEIKIEDFLHYYLGCTVVHDNGKIGRLSQVSSSELMNTCTIENIHDREDWCIYNDLNDVKPILYDVTEETITDEILEELWPIIGGAPHLFVFGKDELKNGLLTGYWAEDEIQMDYFTFTQVINKLRKMQYDCDDLIANRLAILKPKEVNSNN